ncbi:MAG: BON domain-containing protein [Gemmatales bacterium]|nr:BON domain-containing protein [Gemmatales bacterium]MDW7993132.1 BON domain-containing protein [Gemmatales bacterium]
MWQQVAWHWTLMAILGTAGLGRFQAESPTPSAPRHPSLALSRAVSSEDGSPVAHQPDDWDLTMRVRAALLADPELAGHNLIVVVRGGLVEVDGPVPDAGYRQRVRQVIQSVPGVRQLRERLRIQVNSAASRILPRHIPPVDEPWHWQRLDANGLQPIQPSVAASPAATTPVSPDFLSSEHLEGMTPVRQPSVNDSLLSFKLWAEPQQVLLLVQQSLHQQWRFRGVSAQLVGTTIELQGTVETAQDFLDLYQMVTRLGRPLTVRTDRVRVVRASVPHVRRFPAQVP